MRVYVRDTFADTLLRRLACFLPACYTKVCLIQLNSRLLTIHGGGNYGCA